MRLWRQPAWLVIYISSYLTTFALAENLIKSTALLTCMDNSQFQASSFDVTFYPSNRTAMFDVSAISTLNGNFTANVVVIAYGIQIINRTVDLCSIGKQLCPISSGHIDLTSSATLSEDVVGNVPGIAFTIPDLDAIVKVMVSDDDGVQVACVQASLTNGKTVQTKWVSWAIAVIFGIGLLMAAIQSVYGHTSTAAHIASNSTSVFAYFQSIAIISMIAVDRLPPIVSAWAQNYQWTMGLIEIKFMQNIFAWYVQATGGTSTNILPNKDIISMEVLKRSISLRNSEILARAAAATNNGAMILARATAANNSISASTTMDEKETDWSNVTLLLRGMQRVAFLCNIEITSLFLTGLTFFVFFGVLAVLILALFKGILELLDKMGAIQKSRFSEYRRGWNTVIKGVLFRLVLLGFPQLSVLCLWELTERDSPATVVLAVFTYVVVACLLGFGAYKVWAIARRSMSLHKNPAYILFSDPASLNRWGFLYVQFRATAYYFIIPVLVYIFVKCCFVALGQGSGKAQVIGLFIAELGFLIAVAHIKPYMDKATNGFNIAIASINLVNALFFLFFSQLFGQPAYIGGVMGVVFFVINALFSLILLIMVIVSCVWGIMSKNPESRYQPMRDDRESFIQNNSEKKLATELDALGASARDGYGPADAAPNTVYGQREDSDYDSFAGSKTSFGVSNESSSSVPPGFPQARLSRKNKPADLGLHTFSNDLNQSSSSFEDSPVNARSPFYDTKYRGYRNDD